MSEYFDIPDLYDRAMEAKNKGHFQLAANLFLDCHKLYQTAELPVFIAEVFNKGDDSYEQYKQICSSHNLDEEGFDDIVYEV